MTGTISTDRLTLRRFSSDDITPILAAMQDKGIADMIPVMPWPYGRKDAQTFVEKVAPTQPLTFAIERDGVLQGAVSVRNQLGYWLCRDARGQGLATEASRAVIKAAFRAGYDVIRSGHRPCNTGSRNVLRKLGFENTGTSLVFSNAEQQDVTLTTMELSRTVFERMQ